MEAPSVYSVDDLGPARLGMTRVKMSWTVGVPPVKRDVASG